MLMKCHFNRVLNKKSYIYRVRITTNLCLYNSEFKTYIIVEHTFCAAYTIVDTFYMNY